MSAAAAGRPRVAVVVLNYNAFEMTTRCVESARASGGVEVELLVVDNASPDGSGALLAERFGEGAVLRLPANTGYAGGMNAGLEWWRERTDAPFCLLLTQDVVMTPEALPRLLEAMRATPDAGAVGPRMRQGPDESDPVSMGGFVDPRRTRVGHLRRQPSEGPYDVDWMDGACMLLRREAVEAVRGFDERYFMYFEEIDLCLRIRKAGWRLQIIPAAVILHETARLPGPHFFYYMARNAFTFWREHFGVGFGRVASLHALDTGRAALGLARRVVDPRRWGTARDQLRVVARQGSGAWMAARDSARGRLGRQRF